MPEHALVVPEGYRICFAGMDRCSKILMVDGKPAFEEAPNLVDEALLVGSAVLLLGAIIVCSILLWKFCKS